MSTQRILIIGQGLAGSCLAYELGKRGIDFVIVDKYAKPGASRVAAGLVNPATGRSFNASWRQQQCLDLIFAYYPELEQLLQVKCWQVMPIWRELAGSDEQQLWAAKQQQEPSGQWAGPLLPWPKGWQGQGVAGYTRKSAVLDVASLVEGFKQYFLKLGVLQQAEITSQQLQACPAGWEWQGRQFSSVVWCSGYELQQISGLEYLQGRPAKGCIIEVKLPDFAWDAGILHFGHWMVPVADKPNCWRFGANYRWDWHDAAECSPLEVDELLQSLASRYPQECVLMDCKSAIRPIFRRSQPFIGAIPHLSGQYVFSGLGSKGVTTAPLCAKLLAEHLENNTPLEKDLSFAAYLESLPHHHKLPKHNPTQG